MENSTEVAPNTKNGTTTPPSNSNSGQTSEENENTNSRRLWRVPWIARTSNQSILKEIGPEYCASPLATRCEELTPWKRPQCWERQGGRRRRGRQRMRRLDGVMDSMDTEFEQRLGDSEAQGRLACCSPWGHKESDSAERLNNKQFNKIHTSQCSQKHYLQ